MMAMNELIPDDDAMMNLAIQLSLQQSEVHTHTHTHTHNCSLSTVVNTIVNVLHMCEYTVINGKLTVGAVKVPVWVFDTHCWRSNRRQ